MDKSKSSKSILIYENFKNESQDVENIGFYDLEKECLNNSNKKNYNLIIEDDKIQFLDLKIPKLLNKKKIKNIIYYRVISKLDDKDKDIVIDYKLICEKNGFELYMVQIIPFEYLYHIERSLSQQKIKIVSIKTLLEVYLAQIKCDYVFLFLTRNQTWIITKVKDVFSISRIVLGRKDLKESEIRKHLHKSISWEIKKKKKFLGEFKIYTNDKDSILFLDDIEIEELEFES